ncbi:MAG TPA: hypothetical protein VHC48_24240 [Puia sp.]|jgi:hypothetical protein|nr:hypothetical protein [Puia sp.]
MNRFLTGLLLFLLPVLGLAQNNDSTRRTDTVPSVVKDTVVRVRDTVPQIKGTVPGIRDTVPRMKDTVPRIKKAADSVHYTDTTRYHWSWSSTGNINNTNTVSSYLLSNAVQASASRKKSSLNLNTGWIYGAQSGTLTNNDFNATLDFNMYKTLRHFYYWGLVNYNTSLSLRVNNLFQSGGGLGYNILDKKTAAILVSDGILFEDGDLYQVHYGGPQSGETIQDRYSVFRNSFRLKYHFVINDRVTLDGIELIQHSLATIHNYILNLTASGSVRLYKWLSVTAAFNYNKFTRTRSENTLVTFGFTVRH